MIFGFVITKSVISAMSDGAETPHPKMTQDASAEYPGTDIQPTLSIGNKQMFRVKVTTMTFCTMFPKILP